LTLLAAITNVDHGFTFFEVDTYDD